MTNEFFERVTPWCFPHGESEAKLVLSVAEPVTAAGGECIEMRGTLDGPYCTAARTLPTQFALRTGIDSTAHAFALAQVTDPCFWTPALPFLYRLDIEATLADHPMRIDAIVGLRRWECEGPNFKLERKRVVLRGIEIPHTALPRISDARAVASALVVRHPNTEICEAADREGVAIVADLRGAGTGLPDELRLYAWHPSVMIAIVEEVGDDYVRHSLAPLLAKVVGARDAAAPADSDRYDLFAAEFAAGERPPAWLATCGKPVIAISRGVAYADFYEARTACDRLQADLAPEFNLAGYFVAS